jgi:hypothetical protein
MGNRRNYFREWETGGIISVNGKQAEFMTFTVFHWRFFYYDIAPLNLYNSAEIGFHLDDIQTRLRDLDEQRTHVLVLEAQKLDDQQQQQQQQQQQHNNKNNYSFFSGVGKRMLDKMFTLFGNKEEKEEPNNSDAGVPMLTHSLLSHSQASFVKLTRPMTFQEDMAKELARGAHIMLFGGKFEFEVEVQKKEGEKMENAEVKEKEKMKKRNKVNMEKEVEYRIHVEEIPPILDQKVKKDVSVFG